jgi:hypothetical protein
MKNRNLTKYKILENITNLCHSQRKGGAVSNKILRIFHAIAIGIIRCNIKTIIVKWIILVTKIIRWILIIHKRDSLLTQHNYANPKSESKIIIVKLFRYLKSANYKIRYNFCSNKTPKIREKEDHLSKKAKM